MIIFKIYLAGPAVFLPNAKVVLNTLRNQVISAGHVPLTPIDGDITENSFLIMRENIAMIEQCDIVFADLQPFRGTEPDSGTVFEVGYATALGKRVFAYNVLPKTYKRQVQDHFGLGDISLCPQQFAIEDFQLPLNCMISHNVTIRNSFEDCIAALN